MKKLLLVTDFYYEAKGREYFREDLELSNFLKKHYTVAIAHIEDAESFVDYVDLVLLRNTGPQMVHQKHLEALRRRSDLLLFNDLLGKGDIKGKRHLLELYKQGYPVIPTYTSKKDVPKEARYLLKPLDGADSCGVKVVDWNELEESYSDMLIQPLVDFEHEVSFYYINDKFHYALFAPNPKCRWELEFYNASDADKAFALQFVNWNSSKRGIQRVDACRLKDGRLLLMELEDYNPFLSLNLLPSSVKEQFLEGLHKALEERFSVS